MKKPQLIVTVLIGLAIAIAASWLVSRQPSACREWLAELGGNEKPERSEKPIVVAENPPALTSVKTKPIYDELPSMRAIGIQNAFLENVYHGFNYPWAMEFISQHELLVSEFAGTLHRLNISTGTHSLINGLPDLDSKGKAGLLDIALDPQFSINKRVYFSYATRDPNDDDQYALAVSRAELEGNSLLNPVEILVATPYAESKSHIGGALEFDLYGTLLIATGDHHKRFDTADLSKLTGKVLRINTDGTAAANNPFYDNSLAGDLSIDPRIYAYGFRNPQGLVYDGQSSTLYLTDHGPQGGDEVNIIEGGKNYGWPSISYGVSYSYEPMGIGTQKAGMEQPLYYYSPSPAISPIAVYRGAMFPEWEGDLLVGALKIGNISKLTTARNRVISEQRILTEMPGRIRDIKVASDGSIFFLSQHTGSVTRLSRKPAKP